MPQPPEEVSMLDDQVERDLYQALGVDPAIEVSQHNLETALTTSERKRNHKLTWLGGILFIVFLPVIVIFGFAALCALAIMGVVLVAGIVCLPFFPALFGAGTMHGSGR